ncbi:MAG: helix-turn-helix domain-containing protein [Clostridium sp.]
MSAFANNLKKLRKEKKLTQKQLGDLLFIDDTSISKYENAKAMPENELLQKIADFFEVSIDYLLGRTEDKNNSVIQGDYNGKNISIEIKGKTVNLSAEEIQELINALGAVGFDVSKLLKKEN